MKADLVLLSLVFMELETAFEESKAEVTSYLANIGYICLSTKSSIVLLSIPDNMMPYGLPRQILSPMPLDV